ncbi:hypothetical protein RCO28_37530 [Streptomyces sp. LHD-70]|uniref:hypothetical protein n=1 Tax=Streptomyces sp. LHD-70 TaxID=3072140 RepID=UPI00280E282F|nr:hypothetical protein [Streptomyces sp. LHD-70]MDQ8708120.1 hypothetical protein [Streptomyces sp. LHD-70]
MTIIDAHMRVAPDMTVGGHAHVSVNDGQCKLIQPFRIPAMTASVREAAPSLMKIECR